jgi:hypothetical protein
MCQSDRWRIVPLDAGACQIENHEQVRSFTLPLSADRRNAPALLEAIRPDKAASFTPNASRDRWSELQRIAP